MKPIIYILLIVAAAKVMVKNDKRIKSNKQSDVY